MVGWLFAGIAFADNIDLSWTNPTGTEVCTDDGPLDNWAGTRIWQLVTEINDPNVTNYQITGALPGEYLYVSTAFDTDDEESRLSGSASKTVTSFMASTGATVYQAVSISNAWWLLPVGTMSSDTECIVGTSANDKYAVPTSAVSWSPGTTVRPLLVFSDCQ